ncbi:MAG: hypothetical protein AAF502_18750 [Bacteroidota bacterium]
MIRIFTVLLLPLLILSSINVAEAQRRPYDPEAVTIGLRFNGSTTLAYDEDPLFVLHPDTGDSTLVTSPSTRIGFSGGFWFRFPLYPFYLQPELLVSAHKAKYEYASTGQTFYETLVWQIEVPLAIGVKVGPIRGQAGVVPTIFVGRGSLKDIETFDKIWDTATINYQLGVGIDIGRRLVVDGRLEGPLGLYRDPVVVGDSVETFIYKARKIVVGIGFVF